MGRKEFLRSMGAGATFDLLLPYVTGCSSNRYEALDISEQPTGVDFTIDLANPDYSRLNASIGFALIMSNSSDGLTDTHRPLKVFNKLAEEDILCILE